MKSEEYLESKAVHNGELWDDGHGFKPNLVVSLKHAKTYGKIVELECYLKHRHVFPDEQEKIESEIDKLMKL